MKQTSDISAVLIEWYGRHFRPLPWRETSDPYLIWLSEVILQQTRVAQGLDYFRRFASRFPDVRSLAAATEDEVLKLWQGLGYYSRARNLQKAARQIMDDFGGGFPSTYEDIHSLRHASHVRIVGVYFKHVHRHLRHARCLFFRAVV